MAPAARPPVGARAGRRGAAHTRARGLARHRKTLAGGDADKGRQIVLNNAAVYCQRCHKLDGQGGEVGPPLNGIGAKQTREYLLESIVHPQKQIAEGWESIAVRMKGSNTVHTGVVRGETDDELRLEVVDKAILDMHNCKV